MINNVMILYVKSGIYIYIYTCYIIHRVLTNIYSVSNYLILILN